MMFFLLIINLVILLQVLSSHSLWGKPLNSDQLNTIKNFTIYPIIISVATTALALILIGPIGNRSRLIDAAIVIMAGFVPIVAMIVSMIGILWTYYSAEGSSSNLGRSSASMNIQQAAKFLQMPTDDVMALVKSGRLQARKIDGQYRFDPEILNALRSIRRGSTKE